MLRRALEEWFDTLSIRPRIVAELDDATMGDVLGEAGRGVFAVPALIEAEVRRCRRVRRVALVADLRQRFYAVSPERRIRHPAVLAICRPGRLEDPEKGGAPKATRQVARRRYRSRKQADRTAVGSAAPSTSRDGETPSGK